MASTAMALPVVKTFADVVDFEKTVLFFVPQLYELPHRLLDSITDPNALLNVYTTTNPFVTAFAFALFISPIFLIVSEVNKNYSQVDRVWSILPTIYNIHFAVFARLTGLPTKRLDTLALVSIIWSIRLTYNYWRKGGYEIGSEDYRWEILRKHINPPLFFIFNVGFISLGQSILLLLAASPTYILLLAAKGTGVHYETGDVIFSRGMVLLVLLAYLADGQQWSFHEAKHEYQKSAKVPPGYYQEDLDRGFNCQSLWSLARHPNFTAEQAFWVTLYAWSCWTTKGLLNWTVVGALGYLTLFQASTLFTESISAKKYPEYKEYQKRVGKFLPKLPGGPPGNFSDRRKSTIEAK